MGSFGPIYKRGKRIVTAQPVRYDPYFTDLDAGDTRFALTVSRRGLERPAVWTELVTGYPFSLWASEAKVEVPIMARNEILAEKVAAWWIFGPAKHYADIAYLGGLLLKSGLPDDSDTRADVRELVEIKVERNRDVSATHRERIAGLDEEVRRDRLLNPERYVDSARLFQQLSFVGARPPSLAAMKRLVEHSIFPLLFD